MFRLALAIAALAACTFAGTPASANCDKPDRVHGGTPFLHRLAGSWHLTGTWQGRTLDRELIARMESETLHITVDEPEQAPFGHLAIRYRPECDDFIATRIAGGATSQGSGISRGDALDMTFGTKAAPRHDIAFEWDRARGVWELFFARERRSGGWERLGRAELRTGAKSRP
jgi:hypothetical protein